jgi:hypothetical protein
MPGRLKPGAFAFCIATPIRSVRKPRPTMILYASLRLMLTPASSLPALRVAAYVSHEFSNASKFELHFDPAPQSRKVVPGRNWPTSSAHPTAATAAIEKARKKRGKILKGQLPVISSPPEDTRVRHCSASLATRQVHGSIPENSATLRWS